MGRYYRNWGGGWGGGWGRGPFMRRRGFPLFGGGGFGLGMGGGGLMGDLLAGGLGYMVGKQQGTQNQQNPPQYQPPAQQYTQYPPQYQPPVQQYQQGAPQYQPPVQQYQQNPPQYQPQTPQGNAQSSQIAQLRLLGDLHDKGVLTNDEFQKEKQKILNGF